MVKAWLILLIVLIGCKGKPDVVEHVTKEDDETTYSVSRNSEAMNAAIQEAIRNYPLFERAMQQPDTASNKFSVNLKFTYGDSGVEYMWVDNLHIIGGQLFGVLYSEPFYVKGINKGDTLRVTRKDISDWMYVKNGKLQGGYTIKVIYNSLNEKEKKEFLKSKSYEIE